MIIIGILCSYIGIFCGDPKPEKVAVWPHSQVKFSNSYLGPSIQLLLYLSNTLRAINETTDFFSSQKRSSKSETKNLNYKYDSGIHSNSDDNFSDEDKLAVIQILEKSFINNFDEYFDFSVNWETLLSVNEQTEDDYYEIEDGNYRTIYRSERNNHGNVRSENGNTKSSLKSGFKERLEKSSVYKIPKKHVKNYVLNMKFDSEENKVHNLFKSIWNPNDVELREKLEPIIDSQYPDIFYNRFKIDQLQNDTSFKELVDLLHVTDDINNEIAVKDIDINLMFDELLQFLEYMQEIFESIDIIPNSRTNKINFKNRVKVSDVIAVLNFRSNYTSVEIKSLLRSDLNEIINVDELIDSLKRYENITAKDELEIPVKLPLNDKVYSLLSIVDAVLHEETRTNNVEEGGSVLKFGKIPNDVTISSVSSRKTNINSNTFQDFTVTVPFLLGKMCNLLITESKVRGLRLFQGYSPTLIDELTKTNYNSSQQQLDETLEIMLKRKDSVWPPALMLAKFLREEINSPQSEIALSLATIQPLKYT